jgi:hypothetical protein
MTSPAVLRSVNVGLPRDVSWQGKTVYTGVWKHPVDGPVLVYQIQPYRHRQQHFGLDDLGYGAFGENLTVDGLPDDEASRCGSAPLASPPPCAATRCPPRPLAAATGSASSTSRTARPAAT